MFASRHLRCSHLWLVDVQLVISLIPGIQSARCVCRLAVHDCLAQLANEKGCGVTHGLCHSDDTNDEVASKVPSNASISIFCLNFFRS